MARAFAAPRHTPGPMRSNRLLLLAVVGEGVLALVAVSWMTARGRPVTLGPLGRGLALGLCTAAGFALANFYLLWYAPGVAPVRSIRRLYASVLRPLFADVGPHEVVGISIAAGVGEELLFRGAVQPDVGLLAASLLFGALHIGGGGTVAFGCWAAVLGMALGWLALVTGGLLAPILAHVVYDAVAIAYIRWWAPGPREKLGG